jgi:hypothetical protein
VATEEINTADNSPRAANGSNRMPFAVPLQRALGAKVFGGPADAARRHIGRLFQPQAPQAACYIGGFGKEALTTFHE